MYAPPTRAAGRSRASRTLRYPLMLLLAVVLSVVAQAQGGVGSTRGLPTTSGGTNSIQGRVIFPTNQPGTRRIRVRLESPNFINESTMTGDDGTFQFTRLEAGYYRVTVDGEKEYDAAAETVSIDRETSGTGRTVQVQIMLKLKGSGVDTALAGVPKEAADLYVKGVEAARKNESKKAVEHLKKAVEIHPNFALALNELGVQYLKLAEIDKAVEALASAVKLSPAAFSPRLNYGIALLNQKKFAEAELQLRQALTINSSLPTAHMYLGIALLNMSKDEKTKQFNVEKYTEAQKELEIAISTGKDEVALAHRYLGGIYAGNREYKRGADELETYLKLNPKAADAERLKAAIKDLRSKQ